MYALLRYIVFFDVHGRLMSSIAITYLHERKQRIVFVYLMQKVKWKTNM